MQGGFGTPVLVGYGNGASTNASMPSINNVVATAVPTSRMHPPSLTGGSRMPVIERITPRSVTATKVVPENIAKARATVTTAARRATGRLTGYARALRLRFYQDISTPLRSDQ